MTVSVDAELLREHLVRTRLAGAVATSPGLTLGNCVKLVAGDELYTFGLSDYRDASLDEALEAVRWVCGGGVGADGWHDGAGWIDPDAVLQGIAEHRETLAAASRSGARVLVATGHPTGLLAHYQAVARALQAAGCRLLAPLDDVTVRDGEDGRRRAVRFLDGVAGISDGGSLRHTHRSVYMEAMLDALGGGQGTVDLVVGDHGMAGAAVERGIPTLAIADVNDPALFLAQMRGRTRAVLPMDDNVAPRHYLPVTAAMLDW